MASGIGHVRLYIDVLKTIPTCTLKHIKPKG